MPLVPGSVRRDGYVISSGRALCDWQTLFKAAAMADWPLVVVCGKRDASRVGKLNGAGRASVYVDTSPEEHRRLVADASVYVAALYERFVSSGQVRIMEAHTVRRLDFGAMRITGPGTWGEPSNPVAANTVLRRTVEPGANLFDTADSHAPGVSEGLIAEALHSIQTSWSLLRRVATGAVVLINGIRIARPSSLHEACEASLRRLRLERIDFYQRHTVDPDVPLEESVGALA